MHPAEVDGCAHSAGDYITLMLYEVSHPEDGETVEQKEEKLRSTNRKFMEIGYEGLADPDLAKMAVGLCTPVL